MEQTQIQFAFPMRAPGSGQAAHMVSLCVQVRWWR